MNSEKIIEECLKKSDNPFITATDISNFIKSPFNLWANKFAPEKEKDPKSEYLELLFKQGKEHEDYIINERYPQFKEITFKTKYEGFKLLVNECF